MIPNQATDGVISLLYHSNYELSKKLKPLPYPKDDLIEKFSFYRPRQGLLRAHQNTLTLSISEKFPCISNNLNQ